MNGDVVAGALKSKQTSRQFWHLLVCMRNKGYVTKGEGKLVYCRHFKTAS